MIQFNLLPDVKQEYIKAKRQKHTVIVVSLLGAAASLFIFIMMFLTVYVFQKAHLRNLDGDIASSTQTLKSTPNLNKILTIQNQLNSLPGLHDQKPVVTRLTNYLSAITPAQVNIGETEANFEEKTIKIKGTSDTLQNVNKFVDTIKFTTLKDNGEDVKDKAPFTNVVLSEFVRNDKETTYTIAFSFDPVIFDIKHEIALTVPKITSTRSETEKPTDLFQALPEVKKQ
jgi:hypothetical protein